ncbi:MAG TPA: hypothetical protein VMF67_19360 [Rhizomicrobium sp.]|nr:hypothetical protein [Rhizomicrobium sp.]
MTGIDPNRYGEIPQNEPVRVPVRRRWKSLRHHFCDGIEAAAKAEPEAFGSTKPRTMLAQMVHSLVRGAASGRCDQKKLVVFFLDEAERRRAAAKASAMPDDSQGNSEPKSPSERKWDWNEDGALDSVPRGHDQRARAKKEQSEAHAEALRAVLREHFRRLLEAERINAERRVRPELEGERRTAAPETRTARIGGRNTQG